MESNFLSRDVARPFTGHAGVSGRKEVEGGKGGEEEEAKEVERRARSRGRRSQS